MSVMAWLFGLGALAIAFPFLFHLIRRTPKGQTEFSSLMFLQPSPPTLTRRSRLENLLLLLMRCAAIGLIAFAFMRPFFTGGDTIGEFEVADRRVAVLLDNSASMQRGDLWDQAKNQVNQILGKLEPGDDVSLLTFADTVDPIVEFDDGTQTEVDRADLIRKQLKQISPSWARSDLGGALVAVSDQLDVWRDSMRAQDNAATARLQIYVVSDMQKGSKTESLQGYQWPANVSVKFLSVAPQNLSNATVSLLEQIPEEDDPSLRVRVVNSQESDVEQFSVRWLDESNAHNEEPISFYVSPGTSRVLKVDLADAINAREFVVSGDTEGFDNSFFVVPPEQQELQIVYLGSDEPDDAEQPHFYLKRCLVESPARKVSVVGPKVGIELLDPAAEQPTLVVVTEKLDPDVQTQLDRYLDSGGTLLVILGNNEVTESTSKWTAAESVSDDDAKQTDRENYSMLAELDFSSQLLQPFANPRFNDFTKIRFWRHTKVTLKQDAAKVLARFDNDDPAIWRRDLENGGTVFAMSSGWHPRDSQLALSTKFVPMVNSIVEIAANVPELDRSLVVGQPIEFPAADSSEDKRVMLKPDGSKEVIEATQTRFVGADQPGIYRLVSKSDGLSVKQVEAGASRVETEADQSKANLNGSSGSAGASPSQAAASPSQKEPQTHSQSPASADDPESKYLKSEIPTVSAFAVNVDRAESITATIPVENLEMFGVKIGEQKTASTELAQMRQMRDRDIENRQKFWKWLILGAIVLLIAETWLASRTESQMIAGNQNSPNDLPSRLSGEAS